MTLTLTTAVFAGIGLAGILILAFLLRRSPWRSAWVRGTVLWLLLGVVLSSLMFAGALHRWQPVLADEAVKTIVISETGTDAWRISVQYPGGGSPRSHQLSSDFVEVRGHLLAFDGLLFELGFPAMAYYGDPVSGGWLNLEQALSQKTTPEAEGVMAQYQEIFRRVANWLPMVRVEEPLPAYLPLRDQAVFDVRVSGHRLEPVPVNEAAEQAWREWVGE